MDLFEQLTHDHDELKAALSRIDESSERATRMREKDFLSMSAALRAHMQAEEEVFYARLREEEGEGRSDALEGLEEHRVAKMILGELHALGKGDELWMPKYKVFRELIAHHIEEEENHFFECARVILDEEDLEMMAERFQARKSELVSSQGRQSRQRRQQRQPAQRARKRPAARRATARRVSTARTKSARARRRAA